MGTDPGPTTSAPEGAAFAGAACPASNPPDTATPAPFKKSRRVRASFGRGFRGLSLLRLMMSSLCLLNEATAISGRFDELTPRLPTKGLWRSVRAFRERRIIPPPAREDVN